MKNKLFNCDEELLELANYTLANNKDNFSFEFEYNNTTYSVKKSYEEAFGCSNLTIKKGEDKYNDANLREIYFGTNKDVDFNWPCHDEEGHLTGDEITLHESLVIEFTKGDYGSKDYKKFEIDCTLRHDFFKERSFFSNDFNYENYLAEPCRLLSLEELQTKSRVTFTYFDKVKKIMDFGEKGTVTLDRFEERKVKANSTFSIINRKYTFGSSFIVDKDEQIKYSVDGNSIISLDSSYETLSSGVIPSYEEIENMDIKEDAKKILEAIRLQFPQHSNQELEMALRRYLKDYKKCYKGYYEKDLRKIKEIIKDRNAMLEEKEKAPYFSKEELSYIIKQIKEYDINRRSVMKKELVKNN